jgi:tetratricopeptide (TPR) repeat protein
MKNIYLEQLKVTDGMAASSTQLNFLSAILRSLLQLTTTTSIEVVKKLVPTDDSNLDENIIRFRKPSDGMPLQILDIIVPLLRTYIDSRFMTGWFEQRKGLDEPLCNQLEEWVQFRNSRTGHGVLDEKLTRLWANKTRKLIESCLLVLQALIPHVGADGLLGVKVKSQFLHIETPLWVDGHAIVILNVSQKKTGWKMKLQLLSHNDSEERTVNINDLNVFSNLDSVPENYKLIEITNNGLEHILEHNVPIRQTDTFEGRNEELCLLKEWFNDEDSRRCLVYGDGGYGKTTLVLELLNQLLDNDLEINDPLPTVICYYTAKMTRWTSNGITHFTSIAPVIDESIRELMKCFYTVLPKEWYSVEGRSLVDKAITELKSRGYSRDDVLIVLDNTETLASSSQETRELGKLIESLGKSLGRIIVTSRRQESIEAKHILVEGLTIQDCVNLLKALAKDHNSKPILQASESNLRKVSEKLVRKPLLLEALVIYIGRAKVGIQQAMDSLYRKSNEELLEFLYEDAWERIGELQREVFYTIVSLSCPLDQYSISRTCQLIEIQHTEFKTSLAETHFGTTTDYSTHYDLELVDLAQRFFLKKLKEQSKEVRERINNIVTEVNFYAQKREEVEREYRKDRVAEAFRNEFAKAAKVASDKGDIDTAFEMYKHAIEEDPLNAALHDRYAWFLFNKTTQYTIAKEISEKSVELNSSNCDAVVNLALINYLLGDIELGDKHIDKAIKLGRPMSFGLLRKAIARYHKGRQEADPKLALNIYNEAIDMLSFAEKKHENLSGYDGKNLQNIKKYQDILRRQVRKVRMTIKSRKF